MSWAGRGLGGNVRYPAIDLIFCGIIFAISTCEFIGTAFLRGAFARKLGDLVSRFFILVIARRTVGRVVVLRLSVALATAGCFPDDIPTTAHAEQSTCWRNQHETVWNCGRGKSLIISDGRLIAAAPRPGDFGLVMRPPTACFMSPSASVHPCRIGRTAKIKLSWHR